MSFIDLMMAADDYIDRFIAETRIPLEQAGAQTICRYFHERALGTDLKEEDSGGLDRRVFGVVAEMRKKDDSQRSGWKQLLLKSGNGRDRFTKAVVTEVARHVAAKFWTPLIDKIVEAPKPMSAPEVHAVAANEGWM
jgi:hypothetical protein